MATTVEKIAQEAAELTKQERLTLVRLLLDFDQPPNDAEIAKVWESEIRARVAAVDEGRVSGILYRSQEGNSEPLRPPMIVEFLPQAKAELMDAVAYYEGELNGCRSCTMTVANIDARMACDGGFP
jgi:Putative addiction module component